MEKKIKKKSSKTVKSAKKSIKSVKPEAKLTSKAQIAVIQTGGKQYLVKVGGSIKVEKLPQEPKQIEFTDILHNKKVTVEIQGAFRAKKVTGVKFKKRKGYLKRFGHRQNQTILKIVEIKG